MTTGAEDEDDRSSLELRKLKAETDRLTREIARLEQAEREAARSYRLERAKALFAAFTTVIALGGLIYTVLSQQRVSEFRREDVFANAVKQLGDAKEELGRVSAVNAIAVFSADPKYESRARSLLIQALPFVREPRTRAYIGEALLQHSTPATLVDLLNFNRSLQRQLEARVSQQMLDARTTALLQENYDERLELDRDYRVLAWPNSWSRSDDKLLDLIADLQWSAETILAIVNNRHEIDDVDMSGVVLARLEPSNAGKSEAEATYGGDPVRCVSIGVPAEGLTLRRVNLSNAVLACLEFKNAVFDNVVMDNTTLYKSVFDGCSFTNVSLSSFRSWVSFVTEHDGAPLIERSYFVGPEWKSCELTATKFAAREPGPQKIPHGDYFSFEQCGWKIQRAGGVSAPPRSGSKQTFYGRVER
jgi:hypothetical protein